jgi:flagellar basal body-associated protein FliL
MNHSPQRNVYWPRRGWLQFEDIITAIIIVITIIILLLLFFIFFLILLYYFIEDCHCEFTSNGCVYVDDETTYEETRKTSVVSIVLIFTIPFGTILIVGIVLLVILISRAALDSKKEADEKKQIASLNARLLDDDSEVDAFYSNRDDFVSYNNK